MNRIHGVADAAPLAEPVAPERAGGASFADALGHALASADAVQGAADEQVSRLATGSGNLHETSLALEKADVAMRVLTKVRNKLVEAYQDVMRMSV